MKRIPSVFWAALVCGTFYAFFRYGIAPVAGWISGINAPLPASLVLMYTGMSVLAVLLFLSVKEDRWHNFIDPILLFLKEANPPSRLQRALRKGLLVLLPFAAGWWAWQNSSAQLTPPVDPPGIHFSLPNKYVGLENPLPWTEENIREGGILYTRNCAMCHGDAQDGNGVFARAWQPKPANFRDSGTIAQLAENYLFWRIKEGAPGQPKGSIDYRSAMPVWEGVLSDDEVWKIIMFEYTNAGQRPARRE